MEPSHWIQSRHRQSDENGPYEVQRFQHLGISGWPEYLIFLEYKSKVSSISPSTPTPLKFASVSF